MISTFEYKWSPPLKRDILNLLPPGLFFPFQTPPPIYDPFCGKKCKIKKSLFPKLQLIPILHLQVLHDYVVFHCSIDYRAEFCLVDDNYVKIALISPWNDFCLILLGKWATQGRATNRCNKFKLWKFWECSLYEISKFVFNKNFKIWCCFLHISQGSNSTDTTAQSVVQERKWNPGNVDRRATIRMELPGNVTHNHVRTCLHKTSTGQLEIGTVPKNRSFHPQSNYGMLYLAEIQKGGQLLSWCKPISSR